jgi:hypothetical protein
MIDFKDAQEGERVSIGKRIQACAKNYVLANASQDGSHQFIFSVTVARHHPRTQIEIRRFLELR